MHDMLIHIFLDKKEEIIKMSSAEIFTQLAKR